MRRPVLQHDLEAGPATMTDRIPPALVVEPWTSPPGDPSPRAALDRQPPRRGRQGTATRHRDGSARVVDDLGAPWPGAAPPRDGDGQPARPRGRLIDRRGARQVGRHQPVLLGRRSTTPMLGNHHTVGADDALHACDGTSGALVAVGRPTPEPDLTAGVGHHLVGPDDQAADPATTDRSRPRQPTVELPSDPLGDVVGGQVLPRAATPARPRLHRSCAPSPRCACTPGRGHPGRRAGDRRASCRRTPPGRPVRRVGRARARRSCRRVAARAVVGARRSPTPDGGRPCPGIRSAPARRARSSAATSASRWRPRRPNTSTSSSSTGPGETSTFAGERGEEARGATLRHRDRRRARSRQAAVRGRVWRRRRRRPGPRRIPRGRPVARPPGRGPGRPARRPRRSSATGHGSGNATTPGRRISMRGVMSSMVATTRSKARASRSTSRSTIRTSGQRRCASRRRSPSATPATRADAEVASTRLARTIGDRLPHREVERHHRPVATPHHHHPCRSDPWAGRSWARCHHTAWR